MVCTFSLLAVTAATILFAVYAYLKSCHTYWKKRGLDYLEPEFFYGNIKKMTKREVSSTEMFLELYKELKTKGFRHGGAYSFFKPIYIPIDPEIIKYIMQKDFSHFVNRGQVLNERVDPLRGHLFNIDDNEWRNLRVKLTPTFTSGKMKMMFQTLVECSYDLEKVLNVHAMGQAPVDIGDICARFTIDVIASCAFGAEGNSLKDPDSDFRQYAKRIFEPGFATLNRRLVEAFPLKIARKLPLSQIDSRVEAFFINLVRDTIEYREKNNVFRKDFMHLLIQLKNRGNVTDDENITDNGEIPRTNNVDSKMTVRKIAAQCFSFFLAGHHTSSTTIANALYQLAENPKIQQKLREEILAVLKNHNNELTYEGIMQMTYLEKVINETLRVHPPIPTAPRICNKSYRIPGTDVVIEPGTIIHIPIAGLHYDPDYYPDPESFDPERFSDENKAKRPGFTFLPFGDGPRICIGARFGMMLAKVGVASIIAKFAVTLNEKTQTPLKLDPSVFLNFVIGGIWLNVVKLDENVE